MLLADWSCFCFVGLAVAVSLTIGLAIGDIVSIALKITVNFSESFLYNKLISFLKYYTTKTGSQAFSFSG